MENINIEVIWETIDELIKEGELILSEVFDSYNKLHDKLEKNHFKTNESLFYNLIDDFYLNVFEILKKINFILKNKIYNYFFLDGLNEIISILNYSYEWLQKNHFSNNFKLNQSKYNYWKMISFFKLVSSCIDKAAFLIYTIENNEISSIIYGVKNSSLPKEEIKKKVLKHNKNIDFIKLVKLLENTKENIRFFNELSNFSEKVQNSLFWKCFKYTRNNLEHQILSIENIMLDFSSFIVVSIFISLRLVWFINLKSNNFSLSHVKKMLSEHDYKIFLSIVNYIDDIKNKREISPNISEETKLISNMWIQSLVQGKKFDWNKYNFLNPKLIARIFEAIRFK